jgi:hypothetical protein
MSVPYSAHDTRMQAGIEGGGTVKDSNARGAASVAIEHRTAQRSRQAGLKYQGVIAMADASNVTALEE